MAIQLRFYTASDDFLAEPMATEHARQWLRSRGMTKSFITRPDGPTSPGETVDDAQEGDLARWIAAASLKEVIEKAAETWVAIRAGLIEAIEAEVVEDSPSEDGSSEDALLPWSIESGLVH
ncbi:MAG: hypothetical protein HY263_07495 [Chloroflexi bacterium]|nr:hypothetical protein [Chloroflexota bacterium]